MQFVPVNADLGDPVRVVEIVPESPPVPEPPPELDPEPEPDREQVER